MLRNKISSSIEDLNRLSQTYDWIPNEHTIRPNEADLAIKHAEMDRISRTWPSVRDFIQQSVFAGSESAQWVFKPSQFRYNLPNHSNHYILWFSKESYYYNYPDEIINEQIEMFIKNIVGHNNFQFAWYKNPKPTVIYFWHVQVFWAEI